MAAEEIYRDEDHSLVGKTILGEIDADKALAFIYGNFDPATKRAAWNLTDGIRARLTYPDCAPYVEEPCSTAVTVKAIAEMRNNARSRAPRYLIVTMTEGDFFDGRVHFPLIGGAIFEKTGDAWRLVSEAKLLASVNLPDGPPKFFRIGPDRYGIMLPHFFST